MTTATQRCSADLPRARRNALAWSIVALLAVALAAPAQASLYELHSDVVYGHKMGMALTYDVIEPANGNGAGVLFMVSGGWNSTWFDPQAALQRSAAFSSLVEEGFTLFLVRHGSAPLFKVPDAVVDVRKALAHIRDNAARFSVDPERLGVFGGSAGGHLSLMLGSGSESVVGQHGDAGDARVAAVVAYFPPVDLQPITGPNDRFPALDFDPELSDDISPLLYASADDPPTLLVHGTADNLVPQTTSQAMHAALEAQGVVAKLVILEGAGHGFVGEHDATATAELIAWFKEHLTPTAGAAAGQVTTSE